MTQQLDSTVGFVSRFGNVPAFPNDVSPRTNARGLCVFTVLQTIIRVTGS